MRVIAITISLIIAAAIGYTMSVELGVLIALACALYQAILEYGRRAAASLKTTAQKALMRDIVRSGLFLIPLGFALMSGLWIAALAIVAVYVINLSMS